MALLVLSTIRNPVWATIYLLIFGAGTMIGMTCMETFTLAHGKAAFVWREVDIDSDSQLRQQYNHEVPVVFIDGRKAFKYRMNEEEFLWKLSGRA